MLYLIFLFYIATVTLLCLFHTNTCFANNLPEHAVRRAKQEKGTFLLAYAYEKVKRYKKNKNC